MVLPLRRRRRRRRHRRRRHRRRRRLSLFAKVSPSFKALPLPFFKTNTHFCLGFSRVFV
tara:strand:- start:41 stop:217 length:177 start_codon:yes stop_codon:yes gene_type:complete